MLKAVASDKQPCTLKNPTCFFSLHGFWFILTSTETLDSVWDFSLYCSVCCLAISLWQTWHIVSGEPHVCVESNMPLWLGSILCGAHKCQVVRWKEMEPFCVAQAQWRPHSVCGAKGHIPDTWRGASQTFSGQRGMENTAGNCEWDTSLFFITPVI